MVSVLHNMQPYFVIISPVFVLRVLCPEAWRSALVSGHSTLLSVSAVALFWRALAVGLCQQAVFASSLLRVHESLLCRCCKLQSWSLLLKAWKSFWQPGQLAKLTLSDVVIVVTLLC